jgi:hypothetical protein
MVLYFYFKHERLHRDSLPGMLAGLLLQAVCQDNSLVDFVHDELSAVDESGDLRSKLSGLLSTAVKRQEVCYILLDGLDECASTADEFGCESERVVAWFEDLSSQLSSSDSSSEQARIRVLFSGQRDGVLERKLAQCPSIQIDSSLMHIKDIASYAHRRGNRISKRFGLSREVEEDLTRRVITNSKGMLVLRESNHALTSHSQECSYSLN